MIRTIQPDSERIDSGHLISRLIGSDGIWLNELKVGTVVTVTTEHNDYIFRIICPQTGEVEIISNGSYFQKRQITRIVGSTSGGSMIRINWIGINMYLEIKESAQTSRIVTTSEVQKITIMEIYRFFPESQKPQRRFIPRILHRWLN
jgi:hypothetical protein